MFGLNASYVLCVMTTPLTWITKMTSLLVRHVYERCHTIKRLYIPFPARPANRSPRHMYIVNLAASGVLMSVVCVTPTLLQILYSGMWYLGLFACKLVPAIQGKKKFPGARGQHSTVDSILAYHPGAPGSTPSIPKKFYR